MVRVLYGPKTTGVMTGQVRMNPATIQSPATTDTNNGQQKSENIRRWTLCGK